MWNRVERQIEAAVKADAKLAQAKRRGQDPRGVAGHAGRAWRKAERLFDEAVQVQEALEQIKEALVERFVNSYEVMVAYVGIAF